MPDLGPYYAKARIEVRHPALFALGISWWEHTQNQTYSNNLDRVEGGQRRERGCTVWQLLARSRESKAPWAREWDWTAGPKISVARKF